MTLDDACLSLEIAISALRDVLAAIPPHLYPSLAPTVTSLQTSLRRLRAAMFVITDIRYTEEDEQ